MGWLAYTGDFSCVVGLNISANNATGFSAVPAGIYIGGYPYEFGQQTRFWSATEIYASHDAYFCYLIIFESVMGSAGEVYKENGYSVRCVRD
jgi:uncharacterized protein (TIGR02145 family)